MAGNSELCLSRNDEIRETVPLGDVHTSFTKWQIRKSKLHSSIGYLLRTRTLQKQGDIVPSESIHKPLTYILLCYSLNLKWIKNGIYGHWPTHNTPLCQSGMKLFEMFTK
jgi:hypothetical protein